MSYFYEALNFTLNKEGGYSNDKDDKGGKTKYGISKNAYPDIDIEKLTLTEAQNIYLKDYWNDLYNKLDKRLAVRLFDLGVNLGVRKSVILLQTALTQFFNEEVKVDGIFGNKTLLTVKKNPSIYSAYIYTVSQYYASLNQPKFFLGWLNRLYKNI